MLNSFFIAAMSAGDTATINLFVSKNFIIAFSTSPAELKVVFTVAARFSDIF